MNEKGKFSILIVDDVEPILFVFERYLRKEGYETLTATDGDEGLQKWESTKPDLVISDIRMPNMSGFDLADAIRKKNPKQKIILMSGFTDDLAMLEKQKSYGYPFFSKPVDLNTTLGPVVKQVLAGTYRHSGESG
jgi:CheY-like chemotaxis protein